MEEQVVFKSAVVGGFDKDSVLDYIEQLNKRAKNNEIVLTKKIEDINESNKNLKSKNEELVKSIEIYQKELRDRDEQIKQEKDNVSKNDDIIKNLKKDIEQLDGLVNKLRRDLDSEIAKNQDINFRYNKEIEKSKRYEQSVMQIGTAMVEAQNKADIIVLEAKNKVLKMSEDTESILKIAADRLDEFKIDVANLKNVVKSQMGTLINKVSSIDEAIEDVQNKFANYFIETKNIVEKESSKYSHKKHQKKINS